MTGSPPTMTMTALLFTVIRFLMTLNTKYFSHIWLKSFVIIIVAFTIMSDSLALSYYSK